MWHFPIFGKCHIRDDKTLVLKYDSDINDSLVSDLLIQASIKTENQLVYFSGFSWHNFPDTGRSTGEKLSLIKVVKLTMEHIFQDQLLNQVQKLSTIQYEL